jgi:PadR family transcriptional regulator, regulatory protein AphA
MSLPHALLGLINYRPATGYGLKAAFKESIGHFWDATLPQIYRTLNQMETGGWLTATFQHQDGKPSRKVYQITDAGRREFLRWLAEPAEVPQPRHPLLIKVFFGNQMDPERLAEHLRQCRENHARLLGKYEKEVAPRIGEYADLTGAREDASCWKLTLDYGMRNARMTVDWCDQALKDLKEPKEQDRGGGRKKCRKG